MSSTETSNILGIFAILVSIGGVIYSAINHKKIKIKCCGKDMVVSVDVESTNENTHSPNSQNSQKGGVVSMPESESVAVPLSVPLSVPLPRPRANRIDNNIPTPEIYNIQPIQAVRRSSLSQSSNKANQTSNKKQRKIYPVPPPPPFPSPFPTLVTLPDENKLTELKELPEFFKLTEDTYNEENKNSIG